MTNEFNLYFETPKTFEIQNIKPLYGLVGLDFIFTPEYDIQYPFKKSKLLYIGMGEKKTNNIDNILASPILIGNKTSHDNLFKENIKDLEVFWEDVKKLIKTFYCSEEKCKSFVALKNFDNVNSKIRCNCGSVNYDRKK